MIHEQLCTYDRPSADYGPAEHAQSAFFHSFPAHEGLTATPAGQCARDGRQARVML